MIRAIAVGFFLICTAVPVGAAEIEPFNPDAPFQQGLTTSLLRSLLNQAFDKLEEHIEIMGKLDSDDMKGDRWHFRFSLPKDRKNSPLQFEEPL